MEIAKVAEQAAVSAQTAPKTGVQTVAEKTKSTLAADNADKYVKSEETFTPAYTKKSAQKKEVDNSDKTEFTKTVAQTKAEHLSSVVDTLISNQASKYTYNTKQIELSDELKSQIEEATGKKYEEENTDSEDYWGAEATAKRIFDFARSLAGDDSSYADTLKEAFIKGFGQAEKSYGGKNKLPGVCYETYDKVIDMFDNWGKDSDSKSDEDTSVKVEESGKSGASAQ